MASFCGPFFLHQHNIFPILCYTIPTATTVASVVMLCVALVSAQTLLLSLPQFQTSGPAEHARTHGQLRMMQKLCMVAYRIHHWT